MSPRALAIVLIVAGVFQLLVGVWQIISTGPGSGFKGHTPGFRAGNYVILVLGSLAIGSGIYALVRLAR